MKVKDLIAKLQEVDRELPVTLADWQEQYATESESAAAIVSVSEGKYSNAEYEHVTGRHVIIGE